MRFKQSQFDFPCTVELGKNTPSFGINRWDCNCLRFIPNDDEGFALRGDRRQLLYRGRRRSHRFTLLGDNSFEYDCILLKEPESNAVSLRMEGAENFDFFKQPDFVPDAFLKGSYAVYKKDTLIGQGTGKLCHIHRPLVIDARGRKCWGGLSIAGNELRITMPEQWLSDAAYPVVVDPAVGTSTVGSQAMYYDDDAEDDVELYIDYSIGVNRFLAPEALNGNAAAYVYAYNSDYYGVCKPVLYSDNGNTPVNRYSANEGSFDIAVSSGKPAGWRSASFITNASIAGGSYAWYGVSAEWFALRFDYGQKFYKNFYSGNPIPSAYPLYDSNDYWNFKVSMYFDYTSAQNHVRALTQGVDLAGALKHTADYKKLLEQTINGAEAFTAAASFFRQCVSNAFASLCFARLPVFTRAALDAIGLAEAANTSRDMKRNVEAGAAAHCEAGRSQGFIRGVSDSLAGIDGIYYPILFVRSLHETEGIADSFQKWGAFIRGLYEEAGSMARAVQQGGYCRSASDMVQAEGPALRHLLIFIQIFTASLARDFLLRRFLVAREELVLKSVISRELILDSKIC